MKTKRRHQLKSLTIIGGFLDGVRIDLATGLNCIIGARGTGKTTILELIRYAMDTLPRPGPVERACLPSRDVILARMLSVEG